MTHVLQGEADSLSIERRHRCLRRSIPLLLVFTVMSLVPVFLVMNMLFGEQYYAIHACHRVLLVPLQ